MRRSTVDQATDRDIRGVSKATRRNDTAVERAFKRGVRFEDTVASIHRCRAKVACDHLTGWGRLFAVSGR